MFQFLSPSGKADRFEWWSVSLVADIVLQLGAIFGLIALFSESSFRWATAGLLFAAALIALWATITVTLRRLRDRQRPLWALFAAFVPVIGWTWLLVECGFLPAAGTPRGPGKLIRRIVTAPGPATLEPDSSHSNVGSRADS